MAVLKSYYREGLITGESSRLGKLLLNSQQLVALYLQITVYKNWMKDIWNDGRETAHQLSHCTTSGEGIESLTVRIWFSLKG